MSSKGKLESRMSSAEWDSNDSSSVCILCTAAFSMFRNRRHHCRQCGRLVCENCSARKMKLENNTHFNPNVKNDSLQRVCDPCYLMLTKKEEKKIEYVTKKEKHVELLQSTSFVSNTLLDVYFLDGSYKTVCYDEASTVTEITTTLNITVKIALFEVLQDIADPQQYKMLQPSQLVTDILQFWKENKLKYVKIVLPLYDLSSVATDNNSSDANNSSNCVNKSALKRIVPSVPLEHTGTSISSGNAVEKGACLSVFVHFLAVIFVWYDCTTCSYFQFILFDCLFPVYYRQLFTINNYHVSYLSNSCDHRHPTSQHSSQHAPADRRLAVCRRLQQHRDRQQTQLSQ